MTRLLRGPVPWMVVGLIGWAGLLWLGWSLWQSSPPRAGFDLGLLVGGARALIATGSPYDPGFVAGTAPGAADLFYAYPPPVAQLLMLVARLPDGVVLVGWAVGATVGLAMVAGALARAAARDARWAAIRVVAVAPLVLPFAIALLFGNLDAWFPALYGLLVLAALPGASPRTRVLAGVAIAFVSIAKLQPVPLVAWVAGRAILAGDRPLRRVLAAAVVTGIAIVAVSLATGGTGPWVDYVAVVRTGAGAGLVDPRNIGPVSLLGQALPVPAATLQLLAAGVGAAALAVAWVAGARVRDPLSSLTVAIVASLVTLPVTWYHYPVALLPVAVLLAVRHPGSRSALVVAAVVADLAIGFPTLLWVAVGILLVTTFRSRLRHDAPGAASPA